MKQDVHPDDLRDFQEGVKNIMRLFQELGLDPKGSSAVLNGLRCCLQAAEMNLWKQDKKKFVAKDKKKFVAEKWVDIDPHEKRMQEWWDDE